MASGVNRCLFIGNLGRDPETRYSDDGAAITGISVGVSETWKDKSGEKQERTEWVKCVFFGRLAEIASEYLKKGSQVYVEGRMRTRKWTDKEGVEKYTTEIVATEMKMLSSKRDDGESKPAVDPKPAAKPQGKKAADEMDDTDIPF